MALNVHGSKVPRRYGAGAREADPLRFYDAPGSPAPHGRPLPLGPSAYGPGLGLPPSVAAAALAGGGPAGGVGPAPGASAETPGGGPVPFGEPAPTPPASPRYDAARVATKRRAPEEPRSRTLALLRLAAAGVQGIGAAAGSDALMAAGGGAGHGLSLVEERERARFEAERDAYQDWLGDATSHNRRVDVAEAEGAADAARETYRTAAEDWRYRRGVHDDDARDAAERERDEAAAAAARERDDARRSGDLDEEAARDLAETGQIDAAAERYARRYGLSIEAARAWARTLHRDAETRRAGARRVAAGPPRSSGGGGGGRAGGGRPSGGRAGGRDGYEDPVQPFRGLNHQQVLSTIAGLEDKVEAGEATAANLRDLADLREALRTSRARHAAAGDVPAATPPPRPAAEGLQGDYSGEEPFAIEDLMLDGLVTHEDVQEAYAAVLDGELDNADYQQLVEEFNRQSASPDYWPQIYARGRAGAR